MIALYLLLLVTQHPGGAPTDWKAVMGEPHVKYRWSKPAANSCLVEFSSDGQQAAQKFDAVARIVSNRPQGAVQPNSISAITPAPTVVRQQTADRSMQVQLPRMGRDAQELQNCYGIVQIQAQIKTKSQSPEQDAPQQQNGK